MLLAASIAWLGILAADHPLARQFGLSALSLAIIFGIFIGNSVFSRFAAQAANGVDFSKNTLLRAGIVLYGFRITFQQIAAVGWAGVVIDALIVGLTFTLAVQLGTRVFKLDRQTAMLIGAGSSICGAAAVMATEPVVRGQEHKVSVAVATVVIFGTIAMFAYPLIYPYLGLSEQAYGIFAGSTIHEVAQVVAAGNSVSIAAANTAVIEKMLRVMMLAPFLLLLSGIVKSGKGGSTEGASGNITIPWFALFFLAASAIHSAGVLPAALVDALVGLDTALLAMAMAALGLRTNIGAVRQAGLRPILLAAVLFGFLTMGGYGINYVVRLAFQ
ncbi:YeiH family protein [Undibacterium sp. TJN25]|uniref:YeiH family protein n=1 Tax=Undibacterium sp. TJN25 TaxID=3413056 RepID=UPI003BEF6799